MYIIYRFNSILFFELLLTKSNQTKYYLFFKGYKENQTKTK